MVEADGDDSNVHRECGGGTISFTAETTAAQGYCGTASFMIGAAGSVVGTGAGDVEAHS
jgi:hypothetical protein